MDEVIKEFVVESRESLDRADEDLVLLEQEPEDQATLRAIFRTVHTIKGTCGFLGFGKLEAVAHAGESLLSHLRDGDVRLTPQKISVLLELVDACRRALNTIEQTGQEGPDDFSETMSALKQLPDDAAAEDETHSASEPAAAHAALGREAPIAHGVASPEILSPAPPAAQIAEPPTDPVEGPPPPTSAAPPRPDRPSVATDTTIRVDVSLLDRVMNLVGELVLVRNQVQQFAEEQDDPAFQRLNHVTTDLQESVMKMRMQPIANLWSKFPRMARDLALAFHKQVQLTMEGHDTELDKSLLEAIKDPLTHLLRNAIDHGIEPPRSRAAAGKPEGGRVLLRAFHEEGQVNIELSDDGAGINFSRIKARAIDLGLVRTDQVAAMTARETTELIFLPGLTTADQVTNLSGRGVGMDVVRTNIENIGGTIDIDSVLGQGSTFRIKIPLTMAIIPALIVGVDGDRFAIPQAALLELVWLHPDQVGDAIEHIQAVPLLRLRGDLLPLVYLDEYLQLRQARKTVDPANPLGLSIVVLHIDDRRFGLVVDEIHNTEEIVVKPLGKELKGLRTYAGATIMGDGQVALILDVLGVAQRTHVIGDLRQLRAQLSATSEPTSVDDRRAILLVRACDDGRLAIPVSDVARLEEFSRDQIERVGNQQVVQYRDQILPLMHLNDVLPERRRVPRTETPVSVDADDQPVQVVVCTRPEGAVGVVVDRIVDIVEEALDVCREGGRHGVSCSAVIEDRVTELIDLEQLVRGTASNSAST